MDKISINADKTD